MGELTRYPAWVIRVSQYRLPGQNFPGPAILEVDIRVVLEPGVEVEVSFHASLAKQLLSPQNLLQRETPV